MRFGIRKKRLFDKCDHHLRTIYCTTFLSFLACVRVSLPRDLPRHFTCNKVHFRYQNTHLRHSTVTHCTHVLSIIHLLAVFIGLMDMRYSSISFCDATTTWGPSQLVSLQTQQRRSGVTSHEHNLLHRRSSKSLARGRSERTNPRTATMTSTERRQLSCDTDDFKE